jgi:low temperature requirement protein LtrA
LRAARGDPAHRPAATRYAIGIAVIQVIWVALLSVRSSLFVPAFALFCLFELLVPIWAEQPGMTPWHPHHVAERYGLMTIIVLGESVLAATTAAQAALRSGGVLRGLAPLLFGGLLIVFSLWWLYFDRPAHHLLTTLKRSLIWGYGHYVVFASAAAVGAGLAIAVDHAVGGVATLSARAATAVVSVPVALFLGSLWYLHGRDGHDVSPWTAPVAVALVLVAPFVPQGVLFTGLVLVALLASKLAIRARQAPTTTA